MHQGYLCFILHAHLPYVRHPEHEEFLEEDWLYEAMTETYIPLIWNYEELTKEGAPFRITMTMTPPLCEMLADQLLQERYYKHINMLIELIEKEVARTGKEARQFHPAALMYRTLYYRARETFEKYNRNLVTAFKRFQDEGVLEVITCCATHGYLPLMETETAIRAQIQVARANYVKHFGRAPRGIWLAECAYRPGIEEYLREAGINYCLLETHGLLYGEPRPRFGTFAPIFCPNGVAAFARDIESSKQVWSADEGYPGDSDYREFYRDLGYDASNEYIRPYLKSDGVRRNVGIKYFKVTGKVQLHEKQPYIPERAFGKTGLHAGNFLFNRQAQAKFLNQYMGKKPIIVCPYDAELYGHWWFEGPQFLLHVLRKAAKEQNEIRLITPSEYLAENTRNQVIQPAASSWGDGGYYEVWLNGANDWIYRHLHTAERRMEELAKKFPNAKGNRRRALNQAARELLLAESSDWAFIMTMGTMVAYAEKRTRDHIHRFNGLYLQLMENRVEENWLAEMEWKDNIFSELDYRVYTP